jgi:hypothetical protein
MRVRVLVKDAVKAKKEFGPYVDAVQGDVGTASALKQAMCSTRAVVIAGACGQVVGEALKCGIEHIVLVSSAGTTHLKSISRSCSCSYIGDKRTRCTEA